MDLCRCFHYWVPGGGQPASQWEWEEELRTQEALSGIPALPIPRLHLQLGLCEGRCPLGGRAQTPEREGPGELTPNRELVLTPHLGGF